MRPPAFEVATTPNRDVAYVRRFQGPIDPAAAAPSRRSHVPIRVVKEGYQGERFANTTQPECAQVMKIARAVKYKVAESGRDFAKEVFSRARRGGKAQPRAPFHRVDCWKITFNPAPGLVEVEVDPVSRIAQGVSRELKRESVARAMRRFSAASAKSGLIFRASSNCMIAWDVRPCRRYASPRPFIASTRFGA